ncbi:class I SAM-dependent methyltransferase, partial [Xanthovirga aplysinae]|uniref:class I SAM-dependent methyltransferase n=1 Tax=Xanthovirga aplysinae TaxID=2529853 RepID=UPI0012BCA743
KVPRKYLQLFSHHALKVLSIFYIGNKVECNVCGHHFSSFLPYGRKPPRSNALCPNCLTLERHRLMWFFLQKHTDFFSAKHKVLHIAPEICFIDRFEKMENLEYTTGDLESPLAKVRMDVHDIPFGDCNFDVAFCNHVMEHVKDDLRAMGEIYRILKPGGFAIIQSPMDFNLKKTYEDPSIKEPAAREKAFGQSDHVRMYGLDYQKRLEKAGFKVTPYDLKKEIPAEKYQRFALPEQEILYFCEK